MTVHKSCKRHLNIREAYDTALRVDEMDIFQVITRSESLVEDGRNKSCVAKASGIRFPVLAHMLNAKHPGRFLTTSQLWLS